MKATLLFVSLLGLQVLFSTARKGGTLDAQTDFSLDLLRLANAKSLDKPVVLAPFSISMLLTLMMTHSDGSVQAELSKALTDSTASRLHILVYFKHVLNSIPDTLAVYNGIYVNNRSQIDSGFAFVAKREFNMEAVPRNFADRTTTAKKINKDVENATKRKIKQIISEADIDQWTSLILVNAIYFNDKWQQKFNVKDTVLQQFSNSRLNRKMVPFMLPPVKDGENADDYKYYEDDNMRCVALPFETGNMTAYIILPTREFRLDAVLNNLNSETFRRIRSAAKKERIQLAIPKFNLESEFDVKDLLKKQFPRTFSATYDKIAPSLKIDQFKHKATLEVDEEGATASASTVVSIDAHIGRSTTFYANQPFLLLLAAPNGVIHFEAVVRL